MDTSVDGTSLRVYLSYEVDVYVKIGTKRYAVSGTYTPSRTEKKFRLRKGSRVMVYTLLDAQGVSAASIYEQQGDIEKAIERLVEINLEQQH